MSKGRVIVRNTFFLVLAHGSTKVFSIALTAIAGRVLGPVGFGVYITGSALVEVGRVLAAGGLNFLVAREVASDVERGSYVASNAAAVKLMGSAITYAVLLAIAAWGYPPPVLFVVAVLGSALFLENLSDLYDAVFQGREQMQYTTLALGLSAAVIFVLGSSALLSGLGLRGYCVAMAVGFATRLGIMTVVARRGNFVHLRPRLVEKPEVKRLLVAGAPLLGATVVSLLFHRVDLLMLGQLADEAQVGLYGAAVRIIDVVVLLPRVLATAVYPSLRKSQQQDGTVAMVSLMERSTRLSLVLCSAAGLGVWILAQFALRWIPGEEFVPATGALRLLAWGVVLQGGSHLMARLLFSLDRETDFLRIGGLSLLCNVVLNAWWIPRMGIEGAAAATLVSYTLNVVLYWVYAARQNVVVPLSAFLGPVAGLLAAAGVAQWVPLSTPVLALAMVVAWVGTLTALRVIGREEMAQLRQMLRR